jgi:hypothetical protein
MIMIQLRRIQEWAARGEILFTNLPKVEQISFLENRLELSLFNSSFDEEFLLIYFYGNRTRARDRDDQII